MRPVDYNFARQSSSPVRIVGHHSDSQNEAALNRQQYSGATHLQKSA